MIFCRHAFTVLVVLLTSINSYISELFTSTSKMEMSFWNLEKVTVAIGNYIQKEEIRIHSLRRSLRNLMRLQQRYASQTDQGDLARLFSSSAAFSYEWKKIYFELNNKDSQDLYSQILILRESLPSQQDTDGLVLGIARLQTIYNISAEDFAAGELFGFKLHTLSVGESYNIACGLYKRKYYRLSLDWFDVTSKKLKIEGNSFAAPDKKSGKNSLNLTMNIEEHKQSAIEMIRKSQISLPDVKKKYLQNLQGMSKSSLNANVLMDLVQKIETGKFEYIGAEFMRNIESAKLQEILCKGNITYTKVSKTLPISLAKCHHFLNLPRFQPMKLEVISHDPVLVVVHDILTKREVERITTDSINKVSRSSVLTASGSQTISDVRASQSYHIENNTPAANTYHRRLEALLNRKLDSHTEEFKVTNYGPGGSFEIHVDYWQTEEAIQKLSTSKTNRLITFLFYLSDVAGGATVFPEVGLKVVPIKGSMAAWININADGCVNRNTLHAGCPVITGSKWIMSRYLHVHDQSIEELQKYLLNPLNITVP